jgi:hypothetical protein
MVLQSKLFKEDVRLQQCLLSDPAHVQRNDKGDHVARIQQALRILMEDDGIDIDSDELKSKELSSRLSMPSRSSRMIEQSSTGVTKHLRTTSSAK